MKRYISRVRPVSLSAVRDSTNLEQVGVSRNERSTVVASGISEGLGKRSEFVTASVVPDKLVLVLSLLAIGCGPLNINGVVMLNLEGLEIGDLLGPAAENGSFSFVCQVVVSYLP